MPSLSWNQENQKRVYSIYKKITSIGKNPANDIVLSASNDTQNVIEDFHGQLIFDGKEFNFQGNDKNTFVINHKKKKRSKVYHQDRIQIGDTEFLFSLYDEVQTKNDSSENQADSNHSEVQGMLQLCEFSQKLIQIRSIPEQINALLDAVIEITQADKGFVILLENDEPRIAAARNVDQVSMDKSVSQLSDSIVKKVIETRAPLIVSDALKDPNFNSSESVINLKLSSVMAAPLLAQGQLLGVIYIGNNNAINLFQSSSLQLFRVLTSQASFLLQNALLLNQLEEDKERIANELEEKQFGEMIGACKSLQSIYKKSRESCPNRYQYINYGRNRDG
jgi:pSer/pThr/pTyr-binding forkhead associated (FHA) protein